MAFRPFSYAYPFDVRSAMEPWREKLGSEDFDRVIARLTDRDRAIEDHVNLNVSQGYLGIAKVAADQAGLVVADSDLTGLSVAVTLPSPRRLILTAHGRLRNDGAGTSIGTMKIKEGATTHELRITPLLSVGGAIGDSEDLDFCGFVDAGTGPHTYKLTGSMSSGSGTLVAFAENEAYITVEDIGPLG